MRSVGAQDKVLVELIADDRRDAAVDYIENWGNDARRFPTHATPGRDPGRPAARPRACPTTSHLMSDSQLELISRLMRAVWDGDTAHRHGLGLHPQHRPRRQPAGDRSSSWSPPTARPASRWTIETFDEPRLDVFGRPLALRLPPRRLAGPGDPADQVPGRRRPGLVLRAHDDGGRGTPYVAAPRHLHGRLGVRAADPRRRATASPGPCMRGARAPAGRARHPLPGVRRLAAASTPRAWRRVVFRADDRPTGWWSTTSTTDRRELLTATPGADRTRPASGGCGSTSASLPMPTSNTTSFGSITRPLRLRVRHRDGEYTPILAPPGTTPSPGVVDDPARAPRRLTRSKGGELELMDRVPAATSYTIDDETFTVRCNSSLPLASLHAPCCPASTSTCPGTLTREPDGAYDARLPADRLPLGVRRADAALRQVRRDPARRRATTARRTSRSPRPPTCSTCCRSTSRRTRFRALVEVSRTGRRCSPSTSQEPLADDVRGQRNQYRLRDGGAGRGGHPGQRVLPRALQRGRQLQHARRPPRARPPRHDADPLLVGARPLRPGARGRRRPGRGHPGVA